MRHAHAHMHIAQTRTQPNQTQQKQCEAPRVPGAILRERVAAVEYVPLGRAR
jgi:hypothetical protein